MSWSVRGVALVATIAAFTAGCGSDDEVSRTTLDGSGGVVTSTTEAELITVAPPDPDVDPAVQDAVNNSVGDLVERLGIGADEVSVVSGQATIWPDSSYGCPKPGVQYAQAQVDGAIVILEARSARYEYHSGGTDLPELCEPPSPVVTASTSG